MTIHQDILEEIKKKSEEYNKERKNEKKLEKRRIEKKMLEDLKAKHDLEKTKEIKALKNKLNNLMG